VVVAFLPIFLVNTFRAARQARLAPGNLAISLLRDAHLAFWTRTLWTDESAMRSFMLSGVHRLIMARLPEWCDEAAVAHWLQDDLEPPSLAGGVAPPTAGWQAIEGVTSFGGAAPVRGS
jgi:hypothetical protein